MAKKRPRAEVEAELKQLKNSRISSGFVSVMNNLIRFGSMVLVARYVYLALAALAGEITIADVGIQFLGNLKISEAVAWLFGGGGTAYGLGQRKLRQRIAERTGPRIEELEKMVDKGRSSSRLTSRGETRKEDQ